MSATETLRRRAADLRELPTPAMRRALRKNAGGTLEQVAAAITEITGEEITAAAVGHWERNVRTPRGQNLSAYLQVLRLLQGLDSAEPDS